MASFVAGRSSTPPPKQRGSCAQPQSPAANRFASPALHKGLASPGGFETPGLKGRGGKHRLMSDECSTAAPSPWTGPCSPSPWPSPCVDFHLGSPCVDGRRIIDSLPGGRPLSRFGPGGLRSVPSFGEIQLPDFYDFTEIMPPADAGAGDQESPMLFELTFAPEATIPPTPAPVVRTDAPGRPRRLPHPPLLKALIRRSVEEVREVLEAQPDVALYPFWEHGAEPPLCAAVRLGCHLPIVQLLIQYGANADSEDATGQSPLVVAKRAAIRDLSVEQLLEEICGDVPSAEDSESKGVDGVAETEHDFPFKSFTWSDVPETPGLDLPRAEGLPAPPCWARM